MADDLASILVRNQLDGKEPSWQSPLAPIGSAQMSQWEWAKNYPTLANFLATGLMGLGGLRSTAGAARVPPRGSTDPGITGGRNLNAQTLRENPLVRDMAMSTPDGKYSAVGIANEVAPEAFRSTQQPVSYPAYRYQGRSAGNNNAEPLTPEMQRHFDALLRRQALGVVPRD
jgi:hypothetical protein